MDTRSIGTQEHLTNIGGVVGFWQYRGSNDVTFVQVDQREGALVDDFGRWVWVAGQKIWEGIAVYSFRDRATAQAFQANVSDVIAVEFPYKKTREQMRPDYWMTRNMGMTEASAAARRTKFHVNFYIDADKMRLWARGKFNERTYCSNVVEIARYWREDIVGTAEEAQVEYLWAAPQTHKRVVVGRHAIAEAQKLRKRLPLKNLYFLNSNYAELIRKQREAWE